MHKRKLNHHLKHSGYGIVLACFVVSAVSLAICLFALRANNLRMLELRDAVFAADEQNGDVETALRALREFVYGHMNTDLAAGANAIRPPIQLKYRYERLVAAEKARVQEVNATIYTEAQNFCEQSGPGGFSGRGRVTCVQDYVESKGIKEQPIPEDLYKFDFASPRWSPDLAGWSMVIGIAAGIAGIVLVLTKRWMTHLLDHRA